MPLIKVDFPEPETPVTAMNLPRGKRAVMSCKLFSLAPVISMSRVGVVKLAQEMGSSRLKCTSCRMSLFLVKSAMDVVTIVRH